MTITVHRIMTAAPVIPVMVVETVEQAVPLAQALVNGGLSVLEITLRTDAALEAIKEIKNAIPEALVGAGTVINPQNLDDALKAGAQFIVSPGSTDVLIDACLAAEVPTLPGVNTPSEVMQLLDKGLEAMKFFPAEAAGGIPMLKSIAGPLPQVRFCPTGGVNIHNVRDYLALSNVLCVGGSWMAPVDLVRKGSWSEIEALASSAVALTRGR